MALYISMRTENTFLCAPTCKHSPANYLSIQ